MAAKESDAREAVEYFDMEDQLMPGLTALIIGKRCSGKSILLFDIMARMQGWFNYGLALSPTQSSRQKFAACMPNLMIDKQSPEKLKEYVALVNREYDRATARDVAPKKTYLVCDDTAYDDKFMRCVTLSEIFLNGRNFGTTCVLVLQYLMKVGPDLRGNADFVFVFWDGNNKNQDKIHEFWFGNMPKKTFKKVFAECTKDYGVLVMDVRRAATSRDWHDCVFWYKARLPEEIPPFTMCDQDFFRLSEYCKVNDTDERKLKGTSAERVWRLGPDGRIFDAPSFVTTAPKDDDAESDVED
jgi:hypothetical protein